MIGAPAFGSDAKLTSLKPLQIDRTMHQDTILNISLAVLPRRITNVLCQPREVECVGMGWVASDVRGVQGAS